MGAARIVVIVLALAAAIGLAFVVRSMASNGTVKVGAAAEPMVQVLVAKRDLPVGTKLTQEDIGWQPWPAKALNSIYITDGQPPSPAPASPREKAAEGADKVIKAVAGPASPAEALYGAIVREAMVAGEPLVAAKIVRGGEGGFMSVVLHPGMRAIGIPVNAENGAGGFILPGDRVDIMQSRVTKGENGAPDVRVTDVVVRNVRVLAIDQTTKLEKDGNSIVGAVATLEVPPDAAEALVDAKARDDDGRLDLALRSYADLSGPTGQIARVGPPPPISTTIRVFRGSATTEVTPVR